MGEKKRLSRFENAFKADERETLTESKRGNLRLVVIRIPRPLEELDFLCFRRLAILKLSVEMGAMSTSTVHDKEICTVKRLRPLSGPQQTYASQRWERTTLRFA